MNSRDESGRRLLPMFPLGTPLLPGSVLPLHVFELRYRIMMDDVVHAAREARGPEGFDDEVSDGDLGEFGVVLIERGREVGGGDVRGVVGTLAIVVRHDEMDDGRRAVLVIGHRRIRVEEWLDDDPYPQAVVIDWPEVESTVGSDLEERLDAAVERFVDLVRTIDDRTPRFVTRSAPETVDEYAYRVASTLPLGPSDRQRILESADTGERVRRLVAAVEDLDAMVRFRLGAEGTPE